MTNYAKHMPSRAELTAWIRNTAAQLYDYCPSYAPNINHYRTLRPVGWAGRDMMLKHYGYSKNAAGWNEFVEDLTGMHIPTAAESMQKECDHIEHLPDGEQQQAMCGHGGLPVIPKVRAVMAWHWPTHSYVPHGYERVYVVR